MIKEVWVDTYAELFEELKSNPDDTLLIKEEISNTVWSDPYTDAYGSCIASIDQYSFCNPLKDVIVNDDNSVEVETFDGHKFNMPHSYLVMSNEDKLAFLEKNRDDV